MATHCNQSQYLTSLNKICDSPQASMSQKWTINLHDGHPDFHALMPVEYIPPSIPTLCNLSSTMFHFGADYLHPTKGPQHDLPCLAPPKGEMTSSFSLTSLFKSPTSRTSCLGDPTLSRINQVISMPMCETLFCAAKSATKPLNK